MDQHDATGWHVWDGRDDLRLMGLRVDLFIYAVWQVWDGRDDLKLKLADLSSKLAGFRAAFEDMQDFIDVQVNSKPYIRFPAPQFVI